jgi:signal transduction histidine kinase
MEGRSVLVRHVAEADLLDLAQDEKHLELWRRVSPTCYMCAPLRAGNRIAGAIALFSGEERRRYDVADLALLDEIASRASLAMENARLYYQARHAIALRDDVLAIVSHDLRNPLATISMALARLEEEPERSAPKRAELLHIAHESADSMQSMIQDLLDVASIDAGHLSVERVNADLVILLVQAGALFEQLFADQGIDFALDVPEYLPRVAVDRERILQLLGDLLSNALKFTPAGGHVTLSARDKGNEVVVSVRDTGCGIPHDDLPHLFDRFWFSRRGAKARGTGLGLSIAKGIVEAHGGRIWADTVEGAGSVFSFTLPVSDESPRTA